MLVVLSVVRESVSSIMTHISANMSGLSEVSCCHLPIAL